MPQRIQRKRTKGWRMPPNTVYVGRGSKWGNPFAIGKAGPHGFVADDNDTAVVAYAIWLGIHGKDIQKAAKEELRGKNLACWCSLDQECHADILLRLANE